MFSIKIGHRYLIGGHEVSKEKWDAAVDNGVSAAAINGVKLVVQRAVGDMKCDIHGESAEVSLVVVEKVEPGNRHPGPPDLETNISGCCGPFVRAVEQRMNQAFIQACSP